MDVNEPLYQVGQRLHHPQFGDGLIVEVHTDRGREVLEVVFDGQLRRLSATRAWEIVDGTAADGTHGSEGLPAAAAAADAEADELDGANGDAEPGAAFQAPRAPGLRRHWHPQGDALLRRWLDNAALPQSHFDLRADAEAWAGWASADRLVSLESLRGVERFPHQIRACLG